ncbi:HAD-IA family hydrolase [bacterium]|nr:HAD-IA family hydrolase [bacterium]
MKFKTIIFDLDGTLIDSYHAIQESLNYVLEHYGLAKVDLPTVKKMVGRGLENLMQRAVGDQRKEQAIALFRKSYDETVMRGTFLLPEVAETIRALHEKGIKMAVASNKPSIYSRTILENFELNPFFEACYGPDVVKQPKPHPAMLEGLMKELSADKKETLYVGDMVIDVETARTAGVSVALIATGGNRSDELRSMNPDYFLNSFASLRLIIE